jgi:hypothetical protein
MMPGAEAQEIAYDLRLGGKLKKRLLHFSHKVKKRSRKH